ncbi:uncharacterized protein HMPREF1541_00180 [Cyphellophora europaea CBS 101466]|uniref:DUF7918 domain-containing protein n=1 Tax=Cyphellophora europaea (strain CBS 101466) TaxID=1220924 RepID=W2SBC1_CYPE1|nr:uncharacterized protein HMPREF1541_00180 [Cyphellophora europaea CBS 101466]ETN45997.1 hypothetical protein HMPREF1541_00180 [Cyphellophora europaea CBS 101466]
MAILDHATVQVMCEGNQATEYNDPEDDVESMPDNTILKYIEVQSGASFEIRCEIDYHLDWKTSDVVSARVSLDGQDVTGIAIRRCTCPRRHKKRGAMKGVYSGSGSDVKLLQFTFADLETCDLEVEDDRSKFKEMFGNLGSIKVEMYREKLCGYTESSGKARVSPRSSDPIPEKGLKGRPLDVATTYKVVPAERRHRAAHTEKVEDEPFATFIFKYLTRRGLQSLLIIDRSPTPIPLEDRPIEELTREELMELERRRRANGEIKHEKIKRERDLKDATPMRPLKKSKGPNGCNVYHIDSDDDQTDDQTEQPLVEFGGTEGDSDVEVVTLR